MSWVAFHGMFRVIINLYSEVPLYQVCSIWLNVRGECIPVHLRTNPDTVSNHIIHSSIGSHTCSFHNTTSSMDHELLLSFVKRLSSHHSDTIVSWFNLSKESDSRVYQASLDFFFSILEWSFYLLVYAHEASVKCRRSQ